MASIVIGSATGGAVTCLVLLASYGLVHGAESGAVAAVVGLGGFGGVAAGGGIAWVLGRSLGNPWRRAMLAMMGVMGSALLVFLTTVADLVAGRWGLVTLAAACVVAIAVAHRLWLASRDSP